MILDKAFNPLEPSTLKMSCEDFSIINIANVTLAKAMHKNTTSLEAVYIFLYPIKVEIVPGPASIGIARGVNAISDLVLNSSSIYFFSCLYVY